MLRSMKSLIGYQLNGHDGSLGRVVDLQFDDESWRLRHVAVKEKGLWRPRIVFVDSSVLDEVQTLASCVYVSATKDKIENNHDLGSTNPVCVQKRREQPGQYVCVPCFEPALGVPPLSLSFVPREKNENEETHHEEDPHLRSFAEVSRYSIEAVDASAGRLEDFMLDDADWVIRLMIVNTGRWFSGRQVVLPVDCINQISWDEKKISIPLRKSMVEEAPLFDPEFPVNDKIERCQYDYHGRLQTKAWP